MKNPLKYNIPIFRIILQWLDRLTGYIGEFGELHLDVSKWSLRGHDGVTPNGIPIKTDIDDVLRASKVAKSNDYRDLDYKPDLNFQPLDADLTAIAALTNIFGLLRKTANNTWEIDTNTYLNSTDSRIAQWVEAYSWGDHAAEDYLKLITKAMVEAVLTGNISTHIHSIYLTAITKAMVEAVLTGVITSHTHDYSPTDEKVKIYGGTQAYMLSPDYFVVMRDGNINYIAPNTCDLIEENAWGLVTALAAFNALAAKQDTLVSGTNIKTVNGQNLLGSGNIAITATADGTGLPEVPNDGLMYARMYGFWYSFVLLTLGTSHSNAAYGDHNHDSVYAAISAILQLGTTHTTAAYGDHDHDSVYAKLAGLITQEFSALQLNLPNHQIKEVNGELVITKTGSSNTLVWGADDKLTFSGEIKAASFYKA